jgi:hypothetical protein
MLGTHIILNITNIIDANKIAYKSTIIELFDLIVEKLNLNVVDKAIYQFQPIGVTAVYVLAESHLSIHTFPEEKKAALDLFTCAKKPDIKVLLDIITSTYKNCIIDYNIIDR